MLHSKIKILLLEKLRFGVRFCLTLLLHCLGDVDDCVKLIMLCCCTKQQGMKKTNLTNKMRNLKM